MLGLSLLLHIVLIAFIPGFGIFLPAGDVPFIEIETILFSPDTGGELGTEPASESAPGEFVAQSNLTVSEPERFEKPDVMAEWDRTVLDREVQPLEVPETERVPENRSPIEPEALTVQVELPQKPPELSPEQPDSFERPESATRDELTENAEQPFDLAALRGEEPPPEPEEEFIRRALPELPENHTILQAPKLAEASRSLSTKSVVPPARSFQSQSEVVDDVPELRLPERQDLPEAEDETLALPSEELRIVPQANAVPDSDEFPDFQTRPLPEPVISGALVFVPERKVEELRPVIAAEALPQQRNFHQKTVDKEAAAEPLPRVEPVFPDRDDSIARLETPQISPERPEDRAVLQEDDEEPALPFSAKNVIKDQSKMVFHRAASATPVRVKPELDETELRKIPPPAQTVSPPAGFPMNQAFAFERPTPIEHSEEIVEAMPPALRRPKVTATPSPAPLFSVKRTSALNAAAFSPGPKPLPRLFADSASVRREDISDAEPVPFSRSFGTRRAGLLPVTRAILPQFESEKPVQATEDEILEEAATDGAAGNVAEFTIEGPASGREVVYKPLKLPELAIEMEVNIRLKFWVLPDGSIGDVVPLQRGDVRLERAAIQYLKNWRFNPVTDEREVWGIIPIRYSLQ